MQMLALWSMLELSRETSNGVSFQHEAEVKKRDTELGVLRIVCPAVDKTLTWAMIWAGC